MQCFPNFEKSPWRTIVSALSRLAVFCGMFLALANARTENIGVIETVSPKKTFKIIQQNLAGDDFDPGKWKSRIQFIKKRPFRGKLLDGCDWPADYYISPDERWIFQIQKSGSGDNIAYVYGVDAKGRLVRHKERLIDTFLNFTMNSDHRGFAFSSWNAKRGLLHFTFSTTGPHGDDYGKTTWKMTYDLRKQKIRNIGRPLLEIR